MCNCEWMLALFCVLSDSLKRKLQLYVSIFRTKRGSLLRPGLKNILKNNMIVGTLLNREFFLSEHLKSVLDALFFQYYNIVQKL